ncbi:MAG: tRNA (adenosine(37)-N6)-threonylcarbamoyltransferase complex dimerization subunit type 1 TsaB [Halioglobus sp.]|nr:tRNA (adenosine(37)-N6)-threonylcarbamoyltransferase complex dimerization subunit type 1 TsaB [Halioglobus sp.]
MLEWFFMNGILAVETATDACSIAAYVRGNTMHCHRVAPRQHSALLFDMLQEMLPGGDLPGQGIEGIAYGSGPGSFTGLRIAASAAQGLAYSSQLPAVAVPTLATLAQTALRSGIVGVSDVVLAVLDARVGEVYAAVYRFEEGLAMLLEGPWASPPGRLVPNYPGAICAVGNGCGDLEQFAPALRDVIVQSASEVLPNAVDMLPLAQALFSFGETLSPQEVQPVYLRDETRWKKISEQGRRS